jgi:ribosomal protein S17E
MEEYMTEQEKKTVNDLLILMNDIKTWQKVVSTEMDSKFKAMDEKVNKTLLPLSLEKEVGYAVNDTIRESLKKALSDNYNSPLKKYAENIINQHQEEIESIFEKIVSEEIASEYFYNDVKQALLQKIAKTVINGIDGNIDKVLNQLKQDNIFRSKLVLMVNKLVEEFIKKPPQ